MQGPSQGRLGEALPAVMRRAHLLMQLSQSQPAVQVTRCCLPAACCSSRQCLHPCAEHVLERFIDSAQKAVPVHRIQPI